MSSPERTPLVSVGMPVYNGGRYLAEAIESILQQTLPDLELVILDNASTDGTRAIAEGYASRDPRVRYERNELNIGVNPNFCRVFRLSRGRYFKWASCNDLVGREFLELCVAALERDADVIACFSRTSLFSDRIEAAVPYQDDLDAVDADAVKRFDAVLANMRLNSAVNGVIRADVLRRTALIPDYIAADVVLVAELSLHGKIRQLEERIFYRRMNPESATKLMDADELLQHYFLRRGVGTFLPEIRQVAGYFAAALRAPLSMRDRLRLAKRLARIAYWEALQVGRRLRTGAGFVERRSRARPPGDSADG